MKKNNKKAFAITELLAVTVVIMVVFTTIYSSFLPTTAEYERRIAYNDVSSQYAAFYMRKFYMNYDFESEDEIEKNDYMTLYNTSTKTCELLTGTTKTKCNEVAASLGVKEIIVTKKNLTNLKDNESYKGTELTKYISYLPKYLNSSTNLEEYRLIIKTETGYANTALRVFIEPDANQPTLTENLLPVYYDETNNVWKVADPKNKDNDWYNYDEQRWANAVTVVESARSEYFDENGLVTLEEGTTINIEDINTMWVWMPRYKYYVFNYNAAGDTETSIRTISIEFEGLDDEGKPATTGTVKCKDTLTNGLSEVCWDETNGGTENSNGSGIAKESTYTHPAFTFGNTELTGIWVGKFENSLTDNNITIIPNAKSYINKNGSFISHYNYIIEMNDSDNIYGINEETDTHLIKNMEWGAISYLTYSQYGIGNANKKIIENLIAKNNSSTPYTGRSSGVKTSAGATESVEGTYDYNDKEGLYASNNQNISGIYDMIGGAYEYTMGLNVNNYKGTTFDSKYFNQYLVIEQSVNSSTTGIKIGKLGDGTKEMLGINPPSFIYNGYPIFIRGSAYDENGTTIFYHTGHEGMDWNGKAGSRSVLVIDPEKGVTYD